MKNFLKKLILPIAIITIMGGFVGTAFAQTPLDVVFNPNPLFEKPNFLPGDETSGEVTVTNNSGANQTILTEAINIFDDDNFGSLLYLEISGVSGIIYNDSLEDFFANAGEVSLGLISDGETKTFTYTVSFIDSDDNSYQGKTVGFDICVGFQGGTINCGDTVVGGEEDTGGGTGGDPDGGVIPGGGSGGGGGGGGNEPIAPTALIIFNEQALTSVDESGTVTITWDTNLLATSQVVYGLAPGPYTLDLNVPNFGYPFGTTEDPTKVINHSMLLTGLIPGQTYLYRVVSRASPPTVSAEHQFTVPLLAQGNTGTVLGVSTGNSGGNNGSGSVLGSSSNGDSPSGLGETSTAEDSSGLDENLALAVVSGFGDYFSLCNLIALIIIVIIYSIWRLWLRGKYEKEGFSEDQIKNRFFVFFSIALALILIIAIIFGQHCPLPLIVVLVVISILVYIYRKLVLKK